MLRYYTLFFLPASQWSGFLNPSILLANLARSSGPALSTRTPVNIFLSHMFAIFNNIDFCYIKDILGQKPTLLNVMFPFTASHVNKGPVIRATFFFNLSRNIVALQVAILCCAYDHVCDQLVLQQNTVLQVCEFYSLLNNCP